MPLIALDPWDLSEASRIGRRHAGYLGALLVICGVGAFATRVGFTSADPWTWRMCVAAGVFLAMVPFGVRT